ncbi:MAG: hypothetical protein M5R40_09905 [Anaerolineae bacterium]|nr:hypothetical protein [Anaerolineae bacterium]
MAGRVIAQILRDRRTLALILVVPLVVLTIAGLLIRVSGGDAAFGVVNQDEGATVLITAVNIADAIVDRLAAVEGVTVREFASEAAASEALGAGVVDAYVTFGPTFSADARATGRVTLDVVLEGSDPMTSLRAEAALTRASIEALAGIARLGFGGGALSSSPRASYRFSSAQPTGTAARSSTPWITSRRCLSGCSCSCSCSSSRA